VAGTSPGRYIPWPVHPLAGSSPVRFIPRPVYSQAGSSPGQFIPMPVYPQAGSSPCRFIPRSFHPQDGSSSTDLADDHVNLVDTAPRWSNAPGGNPVYYYLVYGYVGLRPGRYIKPCSKPRRQHCVIPITMEFSWL